MKILIGCEESQTVCKAFRKKGHATFSCDILPCSGGHPEWHYEMNIDNVLHLDWDMILAFPPCTHLCSSGARWWPEKRADGRQDAAIDFFMKFVDHPCRKKAIENPVGLMSSIYRKPCQIIQPWQFGHGEVKTTCLWLYGLPKLKPTKEVEGRHQSCWRMSKSKDRARLRSVTYQGIADAMANRWG